MRKSRVCSNICFLNGSSNFRIFRVWQLATSHHPATIKKRQCADGEFACTLQMCQTTVSINQRTYWSRKIKNGNIFGLGKATVILLLKLSSVSFECNSITKNKHVIVSLVLGFSDYFLPQYQNQDSKPIFKIELYLCKYIY